MEEKKKKYFKSKLKVGKIKKKIKQKGA